MTHELAWHANHFNIPWAYWFICLLWDLACAQDIFQCMMDQKLNSSDGVNGIADNVIFHDRDDEDHDRCLQKPLEVVHEHSPVFSGGKCPVQQPSATFFGYVYGKEGVHHDNTMVSSVHNMPSPESLSMVTCLSPFVP